MNNNGLIIFKKCDRRISKIPVTLQGDRANFEALPTIIVTETCTRVIPSLSISFADVYHSQTSIIGWLFHQG